MIFKNIKMIAFDVGNTLYHYSDFKLLEECYKKEISILRNSGYKFTDEEYYKTAEIVWRESQNKKYLSDYLITPKLILKYLKIPHNEELILKMANSFENISKKYKFEKKDRKIMPGAIDLITYLHNKGYKLGIISDTETDWARTWLKEINVSSYFNLIILSYEVNGKKASQIPFKIFKERAYKEYNIKPEEIVMVGDFSVDMDAKEQGFKTILLDPLSQNTSYFKYSPDIKVKSLKDIKNML